MADTFSNDLRLRLQESGANSGQWGSLLNDTITNIASAFSLGSEAIPNASTHTITLADDSSSGDEARSLCLKCTGGGQACTVTLAPNTVSKVWIISNETSFTLTFSAGSGANVAVAAGAVKVIVTDGAGSGAAVVDALSGLAITGSTATFTTSDNSTQLTLESTDGDSAVGPILDLFRNSASPGNFDLLGKVLFSGEDSGGNKTEYAHLQAYPQTTTDGSESGYFEIHSMVGGTDRVRMEANATEVVINNPGIDSDFRVESDGNTHMLFVDASNNRVGVGASSPNANLHISSAGDATNPALQFGGTTTYRLGLYTDSEGGYIENKNGDNGLIFRVKTIGEAMRIAGGTGNVGIGTSSPQSNMHVLGTLKVATGNAQGILGLGEGAGTTVNVGLWRGAANNPTSDGNFLNLGGFDGIVFAASNAAIGSQSERARIDSSGNFFVGTTTATNLSDGTGNDGVSLNPSGTVVAARTSNVTAVFNRLSSDGEILRFAKDGAVVGVIQTKSSQLNIGTGDTGLQTNQDVNAIIPHNTTTNANVDNSIDLGYAAGGTNFRFKDLKLSGGIYLGGTGSANYLDDYEEGTWTPAVVTSGYTISSASGKYTKVGRLVTLHFIVRFSAVPSSNSSCSFSGQPFESTTNSIHQPGICRETDNTGAVYVLQVNHTSDRIAMNSMDGVSSGTQRTIRTNENYNCFVCYTTQA